MIEALEDIAKLVIRALIAQSGPDRAQAIVDAEMAAARAVADAAEDAKFGPKP